VFVRSTGWNFIISSLFVVATGACGGLGGGCGACGTEQALPPPGNAPHIKNMPADQTVEGGAQMRVTEQGFQRIGQVIPELLGGAISGGFPISGGSIAIAGLDLASYCGGSNGSCTVTPTFVDANLQVVAGQPNVLKVGVAMNVNATVPMNLLFDNCNVIVSTPNPVTFTMDVRLGIKDADGELDIRVLAIDPNGTNLSNLQFAKQSGSGGDHFLNLCGLAAGAGNFITTIADLLIDFAGPFLGDFLDDVIQDLLPNPLGIAGMMNVGDLLEQVSPGTSASMEARVVPGGFAFTNSGGMSLGVITGLNADLHTETRDVGLTSEPSLCVPPFTPPNLGAGGAGLPRQALRQTFSLAVANEFNGSIDDELIPGKTVTPDLLMGISETTFDVAGHHAVTSGMMCLGVGTNFIGQLNVGTIGILVPSVAELQSDNGNDPLLLVTRPQKPLDFTIGNNDAINPALTIHLTNLEVDFYAFLYERYTRVFTLELTMNVGIALDFQLAANGTPQILPTLTGISAENVTIKVMNAQFVRETPAELEAVLPSVFDLVTPLLGQLDPIDVPTFAGFTLDNLNISRVATAQDDFLALRATLGASAAVAALNKQFPADKLKEQAAIALQQRMQVGPQSRLVSVSTPAPRAVRQALMQKDGGAMPKVVFEVDKVDAQGRTLEWAYRLDHGMFHAWTTPEAGGLVIADRAFAWQGKYEIGLKSRVKGDYKTVSEVVDTKVIIDSVGPRFLTEKAAWDGDTYQLTMFDIVSENIVQWSLGKLDSDQPETEWFQGGYASIPRDLMQKLAIDGELLIYARDEAGNVTSTRIAPFHGSPGEAGGCDCNSTGPSPSGIALMLVVGGFVLVGRRRGRKVIRNLKAFARTTQLPKAATTFALWAGMSIAISVVPGCSCGSASSCELFSDCADCPEGEIAFCIDGTCVCSDDIVIGRLGPYSDVATGGDGSIWVSAYHQQYGDLVVAQVEPTVGRIPDTAWQWVDGVPDGPVIVPQSAFRGGIAAKGEDVGMYTSIAVQADGSPQVSYFDRDAGSLKFAERNSDGVWTVHVIDAGSGTLGEAGALIGMYSSMSIRSDNGHPGIAYLAHVADANGRRAEVRFASATTPHPVTSADWMVTRVDFAPLPPEDPAEPNIYPLPEGLGLFVDLARLPDQSPAIVYYDREAGELKLAKFDTATGNFAAPVVLDGTGDIDAGWSPSVAVDPNGVVHVAYVDATLDDLVYITDAQGAQKELVDDGLRIVGTTVDGLPKPEYHFVGDDAALVLANNGQLPMIAYQDATTQELLLATRQQDGSWQRISVAGATDPWPGGYGFFAADALLGTDLVMSTWVIDQPADENWVEVFRRQVAIQ
jgi:MYXO-CTERM domain-containing protein